VPDDAALRRHLRIALLDEHLSPLLERIRERVNIGPRTLWGSLASGVAYGLARAADTLPGSTVEMISTLLTTFDVDDLVDLRVDPATGEIAVHRRTCCLAFTLPQPRVCRGCCIRTS
jgi:ferric iron reductase protein FhuF